MPVLPKHAINPDTFEETSLKPLIGSGPYVVGKVDPGRSLTLVRNPNYWGRDLPVNRGFWNFDEIRFDYYRDPQRAPRSVQARPVRRAHRERSGRWQTGLRLSGAARRAGGEGDVSERPAEAELLFRLQHAPRRSSPTSACAKRSRCCSTSNGSTRTSSSASTAAPRAISRAPNCPRSGGRPTRASARLLAPFPGAVRADVLDGTWSPPVSDGSGRDRAVLAARARACSRPPATSCAAPSWSSARAASRSPSRSW